MHLHHKIFVAATVFLTFSSVLLNNFGEHNSCTKDILL